MKQVRAYLDDMNLENTLCMLEDEKKTIREQQEQLRLVENP